MSVIADATLHAQFDIHANQIALENAPPLIVLEVVRVVTRQRLVAKCLWNDQPVYAKIFIGKRAVKHYVRDLTGVEMLLAANILTPPLVFKGSSASQGEPAYVLVFSAIPDSLNAEQAWQKLAFSARLELASKLVNTLAQHHSAGLMQTDLYLKNFLVASDVIYTLDGDGIRPLSRLFKKRQALKNLATLFSKMDVLNDDWIDELYAVYCKARGLEYSLFDSADVWMWTQKIRQQVASNYADKKVFRNCTDVKVTQTAEQFLALAKDFSESFSTETIRVNQLDAALTSPESNFKNGNTCTVGMAKIGTFQAVIKRYNIKNYWHGLKLTLRQSRAAKSWANAHRLHILNIATPKPLALLEERRGWFKRRAYFLSEYCDASDIATFLASCHLQDKEVVARAAAELFYKLYLLKISHGDTKATNIKIVGLKPVLIDLDAMQSHTSGWVFQRKHVRDLKRFMRNWQDDAETTALLKEAFILQHDDEDGILQLAGIA